MLSIVVVVVVGLVVVVHISWTQVVDLYVLSVVQKEFTITNQDQQSFNQLLTQLYYDFR